MGEPVIIDDGGSTRIRQLMGRKATGILDHLLEVKPPTAPSAPKSANDTAPGPFTRIVIVFLDVAGAANKATRKPIPLVAGDSFECSSENDQRVRGKITKGLDCDITILGTARNKPIVEAHQCGGQRRYIVSNAGAIQSVSVNAAGESQTFKVPEGTIFTMVVLT